MATTVEVPNLYVLFELVKQVHAAHVAEGARRVIIDLKVDDRRDKTATIKDNLSYSDSSGPVRFH